MLRWALGNVQCSDIFASISQAGKKCQICVAILVVTYCHQSIAKTIMWLMISVSCLHVNSIGLQFSHDDKLTVLCFDDCLGSVR